MNGCVFCTAYAWRQRISWGERGGLTKSINYSIAAVFTYRSPVASPGSTKKVEFGKILAAIFLTLQRWRIIWVRFICSPLKDVCQKIL